MGYLRGFLWPIRLLLILFGLNFIQSQNTNSVILGILLFFIGLFGSSLKLLFVNFTNYEKLIYRSKYSEIELSAEGKNSPISMDDDYRTSPIWILTKLVVRRYFYWIMTGGLVFFFFYMFTFMRWTLIERQMMSLSQVAQIPGLSNLILTSIVIVGIVGGPIGYLIHLFYFYSYVNIGIPIRFSEVDRVYPYLRRLRQKYSLKYRDIYPSGNGLSDTRKGLRKVSARFIFGPDLYFLPVGDGTYLQRAVENWKLFDTIWRDLVPGDLKKAVEHIAWFREDFYVFLGTSRTSLILGFVCYTIYEYLQFQSVSVPPYSFGVSIALAYIVSHVLFVIINFARAFIGKEAIRIKWNIIVKTFESGNARVLSSQRS